MVGLDAATTASMTKHRGKSLAVLNEACQMELHSEILAVMSDAEPNICCAPRTQIDATGFNFTAAFFPQFLQWAAQLEVADGSGDQSEVTTREFVFQFVPFFLRFYHWIQLTGLIIV